MLNLNDYKTQIDQMREQLISRELETTDWSAIVDLVYHKICSEYGELSSEELNKETNRILGKSILYHKEAIAKLAENYLRNSSIIEISLKAKQALIEEYETIDAEDIKTLYQIFINDEGYKPAKSVSAVLNIL